MCKDISCDNCKHADSGVCDLGGGEISSKYSCPDYSLTNGIDRQMDIDDENNE